MMVILQCTQRLISPCLCVASLDATMYRKASKLPEILKEPSMCKQCMQDSLFITHMQESIGMNLCVVHVLLIRNEFAYYSVHEDCMLEIFSFIACYVLYP